MLLQSSISLFYMLLAEKVRKRVNILSDLWKSSPRDCSDVQNIHCIIGVLSKDFYFFLPGKLFMKKLITLDVRKWFFPTPHKCGEPIEKAKKKKKTPKQEKEVREINKSIHWSFPCFDLFLLLHKTSRINWRSWSI